MEIIGSLIGFAILAWLWLRAYNTFLASWLPNRAAARWLSLVNGLGGRFSTFFRWTSPVLLALLSLLVVLNVVRVSLLVWQRFAS